MSATTISAYVVLGVLLAGLVAWLVYLLVVRMQRSTKVSSDKVRSWVSSMLTGVSAVCVDCVVDFASKAWSVADFDRVRGKSQDEQRRIVQAVISFNCEGECSGKTVLHPTKEMAMDYVNKLVDPSLRDVCKECVADAIVKLWTVKNMEDVMKKSLTEQKVVLNRLAQFQCSEPCGPAPPGPQHPSKEMSLAYVKQMTPSWSSNCQDCVSDAIVRLWTTKDLDDVKKRTPEQQLNILQAMTLQCQESCAPKGVTKEEALAFIDSVVGSGMPDCHNCIANAMVNMWTKEDLESIKKKPAPEQQLMVQALGTFNCAEQCRE